MARKPLYDVNSVLSQSIDVFLERGFHGAVMDEIIARAGFNRRGFYLEFGSKLHFFYRVLDFYEQEQLTPILDHLAKNKGLTSIQEFFQDYIQQICGKGCLLINAITEMGQDNQIVRDVGRHYVDKLEIGFISCLEKAQQQNQIKRNINVESTALQLTSFVQGFAVTAILSNDADELHIATQSLITPLID